LAAQVMIHIFIHKLINNKNGNNRAFKRFS